MFSVFGLFIIRFACDGELLLSHVSVTRHSSHSRFAYATSATTAATRAGELSSSYHPVPAAIGSSSTLITVMQMRDLRRPWRKRCLLLQGCCSCNRVAADGADGHAGMRVARERPRRLPQDREPRQVQPSSQQQFFECESQPQPPATTSPKPTVTLPRSARTDLFYERKKYGFKKR